MNRLFVFFAASIMIFISFSIITNEPGETKEPDHLIIPVQSSRIDPNWNLNYDGEIDLAKDAQITYMGKQGGTPRSDTFGHSLATGDIDGDGRTDLIVGAIYAPMRHRLSPPFLPKSLAVYVWISYLAH